MSRIQRKTPQTIIEPESFEEEEESFQTEYQPEHPMLAFKAAQKVAKEPDHLEQYVEVDPFAKSEEKVNDA